MQLHFKAAAGVVVWLGIFQFVHTYMYVPGTYGFVTMQIFYPESLLDKCRLAVFPDDVLERLNLRENLSPLLPSLAS